MSELYTTPSELPVFPSKPMFDEPDIPGVRYGGSLNLFSEVARRFGVEVSEEDQNNWRSVLGAAMLVDHLLDNENLSDKQDFVESFVAIVQGKLRNDLDYLTQARTANYMARQAPARQQEIYKDVQAVDELARRQRQTTDVRDLVEIRLTEAGILAALLSLNDEEDVPDASARESFNKWVQSWSRVGYALDSLVDLKQDFENKESQVAPTLLAKAVLAKTVAIEGGTALKRTPARALAGCAINGFRYAIKQHRLDVQTQQDSPLQIPLS